MSSTRKLSDLLVVDEFTSDYNKNDFHSAVSLVKKKPVATSDYAKSKYSHFWYLKKSDNYFVAQREVLAQEFFRLILPEQPKTRLVRDDQSSQFYVMSKNVPGFTSLEQMSKRKLLSRLKVGEYHHFGEVIMVAAFILEDDFRLVNLGVNDNGTVVKIDGDNSLTMFSKGKRFDKDRNCDVLQLKPSGSHLSSRAVSNLPKNSELRWLCYYHEVQGKLDDDLADIPLITDEINRALLKLLLLPENILFRFVSNYVPLLDVDVIHRELAAQLSKLKEYAKSRASFCEYVGTALAEDDAKDFSLQLSSFVTTSKNKITDCDNTDTLLSRLQSIRSKMAEPVDVLTGVFNKTTGWLV